jgi:hypothetical protein
MLDFNALCEFSRGYCVSICAVLVPANLIATSVTMSLTAFRRPFRQIFLAAGIAGLFSGVMVLHVLTWFLIGIVRIPTYVLMTLGGVCLGINVWAVFGRVSMANGLRALARFCTRVDVPALLNSHD